MLRAVIFDFDLTLVDSTAGFDASHGFASKRLGLTPPSGEAVRRTIGTPLPLAVPLLYGDAIDGKVDEYIRFYQAHADEVMTELTSLLPGADAVVRSLKSAGLKLAIVSQKLRYRVEDVLRREGLLESFDVVLGAEDVPAFKPDPRGLQMVLERLGVAPDEVIYVGDTTIDAEAAARAGLRFVAVLTGPTSAEEFEAYETEALLPSVQDLPAFLG